MRSVEVYAVLHSHAMQKQCSSASVGTHRCAVLEPALLGFAARPSWLGFVGLYLFIDLLFERWYLQNELFQHIVSINFPMLSLHYS